MEVLYFSNLVKTFHPLTGAVPQQRVIAQLVKIPELKGYCQALCSEVGCLHPMLVHANEDISLNRYCKIFGCRCSNYKRKDEKDAN